MKHENHPCLVCPLPDCDETSPRCLLKNAMNTYRRLLKAKLPIPPDIRQARNIAFVEFFSYQMNQSPKAKERKLNWQRKHREEEKMRKHVKKATKENNQ